MSSSALAASELRAIDKAMAVHRKSWDMLHHNGTPVSEADMELTYLHVQAAARKHTADIMQRAEEIRLAQIELRPPADAANKEHWFFITVRPDNECTLQQLFDFTKKFVARACTLKGTYTFEQKATDDAQLGWGFHTHIIASMKQRSAAEVARDVRSSLSRCNIRAIVQVDNLRTANDITRVTAYITDYASNDGHKMPTKESDAKWRVAEGLDALYEI